MPPSVGVSDAPYLEPATATSAARARSRSSLLVALFATTLFVSAFLMFLVEPMIARMVLPELGGAPAVWNTCLVFFQFMLLGGYAYAHGATRWLGIRRHIVAHSVLLLMPLLVLPIGLHQAPPQSSQSPVAWLLLALFGSIGLPFFVLSTSAAVLQKWFSTTDDEAASDPYFLYAASNLGSFIGAACLSAGGRADPAAARTGEFLDHRLRDSGCAVFRLCSGGVATDAFDGERRARN